MGQPVKSAVFVLALINKHIQKEKEQQHYPKNSIPIDLSP